MYKHVILFSNMQWIVGNRQYHLGHGWSWELIH